MLRTSALLLVTLLAACTEPDPVDVADDGPFAPYRSCRVELIENADSDWPSRTVERYNDAGHLVHSERDLYDDGYVDLIIEGAHDERGRLVRAEYRYWGWYGDGEEWPVSDWYTQEARVYVWNDGDMLDEEGTDWDLDGNADDRTVYTNSFLGPLEAVHTSAWSATYTGIDYYRYDRNGMLSRIDTDWSADGVMDESRWFEYGDDEVSVLYRDKVHGDPRQVVRTVYDEHGREAFVEVDWGPDHIIDTRIDYVWTCPP